MKLPEILEIIKETNTEDWFRPSTWYGEKTAFCITNGRTEVVPTPFGGEIFMTPSTEDLMGDWQFVSVDDVLEGR